MFASTGPNTTWQALAWRFYGGPVGAIGLGGYNATDVPRTNQGAIGEVRYAMGWMAAQVGRVDWHIDINGERQSEKKRRDLIKQVATRDTTVMIATNLMVGGELWYCAFDKGEIKSESTSEGLRDVYAALSDAGSLLPKTEDAVWLPISSVFPSRANVLKAAKLHVRGLWPHPANPAAPDPPLRGVLDVMVEIEQLADLAWAQNRSRIAQMGILQVANEFEFIGPDNGAAFHDRVEFAINERIANPRETGGVPIMVTGPGELIAAGKGITHVKLDTEIDTQLESKMMFAIKRLSWGFPIPPEILLGMTATNRATAFQIEESTYEGHIEPIAEYVGRVYAAALTKLLETEDGNEVDVQVTPDPTDLLARKHSVPDMQWAYVNGLISAHLVLAAMGVEDTEENRASLEDMLRIERINKGKTRQQPDGQDTSTEPAVDDEGGQPSVGEAVAAAAGVDLIDLEQLVTDLANIDKDLLTALTAATSRDIELAFSRLGAQVRSKARARSGYELPQAKNIELPFKLGVEQMRSLGVDVTGSLASSLMSLASWWQTQLGVAYQDIRDVLAPTGAALPAVNGQPVASADRLVHGLVDWCTEQLEQKDWPLDETPVVLLREVISVAGQN